MLNFFLGSAVAGVVGVAGAGSEEGQMLDTDNNRHCCWSALKAKDSGLSLAKRTAVKALILRSA